MMWASRIVMAAAASACQISSEPNEVQGADLQMNLPVYLKPSSSPNRKPSFYIPRMGDEAATCPEAYRADGLGTALPLFSIASPSCDYYSLRLPLLKAGFRRVVPMPSAPLSNMIWGKSMPLRASVNPSPNGQLTLRDAESPEQQIRHSLLRMSHAAQRFNHFPLSHSNLGCKRGMAVNICRMERRIARELTGGAALATHMYRYSPKTWFYPEMKEELIRVFKSSPASMRFIWKPARGSCGRGICISEGGSRNEATWERIMQEIVERSQHPVTGRVYKHYVVQEYLDDPLLLEGRKMDLRLYVCVTSFNPLRAYLHEEGLVRLAAEPYHEQKLPNSVQAGIPSADLASAMPLMAKSRFRHLTNYSVGRKYVEAKQLEQPALSPLHTAKGNLSLSVAAQGPELKWSLQKLWDHLDETYPPTGGQQRSVLLKEQIATLIVRTLMCAKSAINKALDSVNFSGGYIELYGFDIMLDRQLNPSLIEINTLPSLESSSVFDYATKSNVAADLLNLAMIEPFERSAEQLSLVTNCPETLGAPKRHLRSAVHSVEDLQRGASLYRTPQEERAEGLSQFTDELRYARGFQCIFPPLHSDANSLYLNREAVVQDLAIYEGIRLLSERDLWALGN